MHIKIQNIMPYNRCYTLSHASRLFVLGSIILLGLATSSCASSDDPTSQGVGTENISSNTNTGVALNHINANVLQTSVQGFTRGAVQEDTATPDNTPTASDGGLTCDVTWGAPGTTRAANTGYNMQWANIGSSTSIAILPRGAAVGAYSYTVSTTGAISSSSPYYFQTASNDVVTSWYPYNSGSLSSFTVQSNQSTLANYIASDLLYTSSEVTATSQNLTYSHKMAQIIVDVTVNNANYLTNSEVQSLTIAGLKTNCTVTNYTKSTNEVCTPTFTAGSTTATISAYRYSKSSTPTTSTATFIMCVPAQTISTSQVFTVTVGGTAFTGKLTNAQTLEWGAAYNISVSINGDVLIYYPSNYSTITYGDYYSVASNGQPVLVKNSAVTDAINAGITPKAVVFALPSEMNAADRAKWPHAYAMALKEAGTAVAWSTRTNVAVQSSSHTFTAGNTGLFTDMGGYEATHNITDRNSTDPTNFNATTYPAFFAALNYDTAPVGSSGWFLPTNGQWERIVRNLGGMTSTPISASTSNFLSGQATTAATNINRYLNFNSSIATKIQRQYNTLERMYWCSGEYDASKAWVTTFDNSNGMYFSYVTTKTTTNFENGVNYSRACIAF